jgi:hypothetical protein
MKNTNNINRTSLNMLNTLVRANLHSAVENFLTDGFGINLPVWSGRHTSLKFENSMIKWENRWRMIFSVEVIGLGASHHDINPPERIVYRYDIDKVLLTIVCENDEQQTLKYFISNKETVSEACN